MKRLLYSVAAVIFGLPLLLVAAVASDAPPPTDIVITGASDEMQVATAPAHLQHAFLDAARRYALPPAFLVATAEVANVLDAAAIDVMTRTLLTYGTLPGGAWDAALALSKHSTVAADAELVLELADGYGYRYSADWPPMDSSRYVFPIAGAGDYGPGHHDYPATDIFAPIGAPVLACVRAQVLRLSRTEIGKGGITITLRGEDGWRYYYAHLDALTADLKPGQIVEPGQLIGTSGNTGNARATEPHLHLGISKTGSVAGELDPYAYLNVWRRA